MPAWITEGYESFAGRLTRDLTLALVEVPLYKRGRNADAKTCRERDGERLLAKLNDNDLVVALDVGGEAHSTQALAARIDRWLEAGRPVAFLIGGPDGLSRACLERADERWSLSALTLPHGLVRVLVAEALYRAASLRQGHPYHRA